MRPLVGPTIEAHWHGSRKLKAKIALLIAVEDDQLLVSHAHFDPTGGQLSVSEMGKPLVEPRAIDGNDGESDDQGDLDLASIGDRLRHYIATNAIQPDICAVSSFGNVDLDTQIITHFPNGRRRGQKASYNFPAMLREITGNPSLPVFVDNDATAAAVGENLWGCGNGVSDFAFVWLGRGVNVGLVLNNDVWRGRQHPEAGHALGRTHPRETHVGNCPIHGDCFIGLMGLRTIQERRRDGLDDYTIAEILGNYLAQICLNLVTHTAPQRIAIGGYSVREGVIDNLLPAARSQFVQMIKRYPHYAAMNDMETFIQPATVGSMASLLGLMEITRRRLILEEMKGE
jgi:fructokinase